jgi:hypothetical protein
MLSYHAVLSLFKAVYTYRHVLNVVKHSLIWFGTLVLAGTNARMSASASGRRVGGYKRSALLELLNDSEQHVIVSSVVEWPPMSTVMVLQDYRTLFPYGHRSSANSVM